MAWEKAAFIAEQPNELLEGKKMTVHVKPNVLSFCSIFIEALFGETKLGIATGFFGDRTIKIIS